MLAHILDDLRAALMGCPTPRQKARAQEMREWYENNRNFLSVTERDLQYALMRWPGREKRYLQLLTGKRRAGFEMPNLAPDVDMKMDILRTEREQGK
jgi:hypothetical protein